MYIYTYTRICTRGTRIHARSPTHARTHTYARTSYTLIDTPSVYGARYCTVLSTNRYCLVAYRLYLIEITRGYRPSLSVSTHTLKTARKRYKRRRLWFRECRTIGTRRRYYCLSWFANKAGC